MIDAYTIGITLALEDGVSEGIEEIRRDLSALDTTIAASAAQLLMLRKLAAELPLPVQGREIVRGASLSARPAPERQAAQLPVTTPDAAAIISSTAQSPRLASSSPVAAPLLGIEALSAPSKARVPAVPLLPPAIEHQAVSVQPVQATLAAVGPPAVQTTRPMLPAAPTPVVKLTPAAPVAAPDTNVPHLAAVPMGAPVAAAPIPPPNDSGPSRRPEARANVGDALDFAAIARAVAPPPQQPERPTTSPAPPAGPSPIIFAAAPAEPLPRGSQTRQDALPTPTSASIPLPARPDAPESAFPHRMSAAPVISVQIPPATSSVATTEPNRPSPLAEMAGAQRADRPTYAELHLDGAALGRWITRHLERQVTRPQSGATAFDPRITPSWSGAPIGN